jgi:hypothetical protein
MGADSPISATTFFFSGLFAGPPGRGGGVDCVAAHKIASAEMLMIVFIEWYMFIPLFIVFLYLVLFLYESQNMGLLDFFQVIIIHLLLLGCPQARMCQH